jgi:O-6-methylguanine DNA methyltransferase
MLPAEVTTMIVSTPLKRRFAVHFLHETMYASEWLDVGERRKQSPSVTLPAVANLVRQQVRAYFQGNLPYFELPMTFSGTELEISIWKSVARIPFGMAVSYGEVARALGRPGAHRAVARSMATLKLALFVPAHRVVGADGRVKGALPDSIRVKLFEFEQAMSAKLYKQK